MAAPFNAYDIRGIYGSELTEGLAYNIGRAFATCHPMKTIVIGYDMRTHSLPLFKNICRGLNDLGVDIINIGLCSTPMCYFANGSLNADASIMITASHNTGEYNGFKLCREQATPVSSENGIKEIEKIILENTYAPLASQSGNMTEADILPEYRKHIQSFADFKKPIRIAVDYANGMGIVEAEAFKELLETSPLFDTLDGNFPNHEANPLHVNTYEDLKDKMRNEVGFDFGIAFDGDADRVGFTDENGEIVSMDLITAIIAQSLLSKNKGTVLYDLRSSKSVKEAIEEAGGKAQICRVGHSFIKTQMREQEAVFAGELSGHYYFRENYYAESAALAVIYIANIISQKGKKLSQIVAPLKRYHASGEINSSVEDPEAVIAKLEETYAVDATIYHLDGLSMEFPDWWFSVRSSQTEPLLRLNLEASTADQMLDKRNEVLALIRT